MSHNSIKINGKKPDGNGDIAVNLSDVITVNSPTTNQILQKTVTDWGTGTLLNQLSGHVNFFTATISYGTGSYTYDNGDNYIFRKSSQEFTVSNYISLPHASGSYIPNASTSWTDGFKLNATTQSIPVGSVFLFRAVVCPNATSGSLTVQWRIGTGVALSQTTPIGNMAYSDVNGGGVAYGLYVSDGTNVEIGLRVIEKSGTFKITNRDRSYFQQVTVKQLA